MTQRDFEPSVLFVDDEAPNRLVFERIFSEKFKVLTASSGEEALELLKNKTVGILLSDQRMIGMSGNELLLRAKALYPDVVRVVITGYSDLEPILRAVNEGLVSRYIIKPWNNTELEQILHWGLEVFSLGQHNSALQLRLMQTERLVTLGSIGAAIIHDLNQPLTYLSNNTERLNQFLEGISALKSVVKPDTLALPKNQVQDVVDFFNEFPDIIRDMQDGCNLMQELTQSFGKILRPGKTSEKPKTDPMHAIRYALSVCRSIAMQAQAKLNYDGATSLPMVSISHAELAQILINLMANGIQAIQRGKNNNATVTLHAALQDEGVRIVVQDNGPGIPASILDKVGKPFFSTREDGTGLGLMQCERLIQKAQGKMQIQSTENQGTTISFYLPRAD